MRFAVLSQRQMSELIGGLGGWLVMINREIRPLTFPIGRRDIKERMFGENQPGCYGTRVPRKSTLILWRTFQQPSPLVVRSGLAKCAALGSCRSLCYRVGVIQ